MHYWLVWRKADEAARDYLYRGIEETGISDTACHSRATFGLRFAGPGSIVKVQASPQLSWCRRGVRLMLMACRMVLHN